MINETYNTNDTKEKETSLKDWHNHKLGMILKNFLVCLVWLSDVIMFFFPLTGMVELNYGKKKFNGSDFVFYIERLIKVIYIDQ